jgi:hypothetical protein
MSYHYETEKPKLFTPDGVATLLKIRDNVDRHLKESGAVMAMRSWVGVSGETWLMTAALDYMVERGEIREVTGPGTMGQRRVFVRVLNP